MAALRKECHDLATRLAAERNIDATWGSAREVNAQAKTTAVLHCHDVQFYSAAFSRLIVDERLTGAAAAIIGSPNVQLHHSKMFIKPPERGSPFPMHQDQPFFPHVQHSMIAAITHFDDAPIERHRHVDRLRKVRDLVFCLRVVVKLNVFPERVEKTTRVIDFIRRRIGD